MIVQNIFEYAEHSLSLSLKNSIAFFFSRWSTSEVTSNQIIFYFVSPVVVVVVGRNQMRPPCPQPFFITTSFVHLRVRFVRIFHHHHHHHHHHHRLILYYGSFIIDDIVHTACPARSCIDFAHFHALVEFGGYGFHALHPFVTDPDIIGGRRRRRRRRYFAGH